MSKALKYQKLSTKLKKAEAELLAEALNFSKALTNNIAITSEALARIGLQKGIPADAAFIHSLTAVGVILNKAKTVTDLSPFKDQLQEITRL
jgi:hypothetical protein